MLLESKSKIFSWSQVVSSKRLHVFIKYMEERKISLLSFCLDWSNHKYSPLISITSTDYSLFMLDWWTNIESKTKNRHTCPCLSFDCSAVYETNLKLFLLNQQREALRIFTRDFKDFWGQQAPQIVMWSWKW